jgi:hypothetical protein
MRPFEPADCYDTVKSLVGHLASRHHAFFSMMDARAPLPRRKAMMPLPALHYVQADYTGRSPSVSTDCQSSQAIVKADGVSVTNIPNKNSRIVFPRSLPQGSAAYGSK